MIHGDLPLEKHKNNSLIRDLQFVFDVVRLIRFPRSMMRVVSDLYLGTSKMRRMMEMKSCTSRVVEAWLDEAARVRTAVEAVIKILPFELGKAEDPGWLASFAQEQMNLVLSKEQKL